MDNLSIRWFISQSYYGLAIVLCKCFVGVCTLSVLVILNHFWFFKNSAQENIQLKSMECACGKISDSLWGVWPGWYVDPTTGG